MNKKNNQRRKNKAMGLNEIESNFLKSVTSGTVTVAEVNKFVTALLENGQYDDLLEKYFLDRYKEEHAEQVGTILENEDLIQKQEETLQKLKRAINEKQLELERQSTTEAYLQRNSLEATKQRLKSDKQLNENTSVKAITMTGAEEMALKTYVKSARNYDFVIKRMAKGSTFGQALQETNLDRYTIDLIVRGVNALNEGNEIVSVRSTHLY